MAKEKHRVFMKKKKKKKCNSYLNLTFLLNMQQLKPFYMGFKIINFNSKQLLGGQTVIKISFAYHFCRAKIHQLKASKIPRSFSLTQQDFLSLENKGHIGHNASKHENNQLDNKDGRDGMQEYKKDSRKTISASPERQIFKIFTSVPIMVASQGDAKLN